VKRITLLILIIVLSVTFSAYCSDYFVDATLGSDANSGLTNYEAWQTITHTVAQANPTEEEHAVIYVKPGIYNIDLGESFPINFKNYMTISGDIGNSGQNEAVVIDATDSNKSAFHVWGVSFTGLRNITVKGEDNNVLGGAIYCYIANFFDVKNCNFENNRCWYGGAIYLDYSTNVKITDSTFSGNIAEYGGAMRCDLSSPIIRNCLFENNEAKLDFGSDVIVGGRGGAISCKYSSPYIDTSKFINNSSNWGGAVECYFSSPRFYNCNFSSNNALPYSITAGEGGAIYYEGYSDSEIYLTNFSSNTAARSGGAVSSNYQFSLIMENCNITNNSAGSGYGGGVCVTNGNPVFKNCQFIGNEVENSDEYKNFGGGGIYLSGCTPVLDNNLFEDNSAEYGGGIYFNDIWIGKIVSCILQSNYTNSKSIDRGFGGGIYIQNSMSMDISNCLFTDNSAYQGGGIFCQESSPRITNVTITNNDAIDGDGIYISDDSDPNLFNCIVWDDGIYGNPNIDYSNIDGDFEDGGNIRMDPLLISGPWGNYYLSHIAAGQLENSPCIDAGTTLNQPLGFDPGAYTTRTDGVFDTGITDMGYHHPPNLLFDLLLHSGE